MKYREDASEPWKELYIKALDSMPIGTQIEFSGTDIPQGWEQVSDDKHITTATITNGTLTSADLDIRNIDDDLLKFYGTIVFSASYQISQVDISTGYQIVSSSKLLKNIAIIQDMNDNDVKIVVDGTLHTDGTISILVNPSVNGHSYKLCFLDSEIDANTIIIKKTSNVVPTMASIVNTTNNSTTDGYSCDYINDLVEDVYSTTETKTNKVWVDGKPIYRKVLTFTTTTSGNDANVSIGSNIENIINVYGTLSNGMLLNSAYLDKTIGVRYSSNRLYITHNDNNLFGNKTGFVVVEYTKTTD